MATINTGTPIVIDNDPGFSKNGFSGESKPCSIFPTVVGFPKRKDLRIPSRMKDQSKVSTPKEDIQLEFYVGKEALKLHNDLSLFYPINRSGVVSDWNAMEKIWHYTFHDELKVNPSEHPVLLTEAVLNPDENRGKMAEILFETFNCPSIQVSMQAVLSLHASGRTTGTVIEFSDGIIQIVPIYKGFAIFHAISYINITNRDMNDYLRKLLQQRGYPFSSFTERESIQDIKGNLCYIALDPEREVISEEDKTRIEKQYTLPTHKKITVGPERFLVPEALFNPTLLGKEDLPLNECIYNSIQDCAIDIRRELFHNIILSGSSTMFPGLKQRLRLELSKLVPETMEVRIVAPSDRQYSAWIGGSILSSSRSYQKSFITQEDYQKKGPHIFHRSL